jgi:hypothetical protein
MDHVAAGVRFQLYPRVRMKREVTLICYQIGSRRIQVTFRGGIADAQKHWKTLAQRLR